LRIKPVHCGAARGRRNRCAASAPRRERSAKPHASSDPPARRRDRWQHESA
jgi:hypothetical protein